MTAVDLIYSLALVLLSAGLLLLARVLYGRLSRFDVETELTHADNPAVGTALFGFMIGAVIVLCGLLSTDGPGEEAIGDPWLLGIDLAETAAYGFFGVLLLRLSGWLNDRLILYRFDNKKELVADRNVGTGAVLCGGYIASGLVLAGALAGRVEPALIPETAGRVEWLLRELGTAGAFFLLGQLALVMYGVLYQQVNRHDVHDSIERNYEIAGVSYGGNPAAGIAFGGNLAALGILLFAGARHDFVGWAENLTWFGTAVAVGLVALPLWRLFVDHVLLGSADLADEIHEDRNINAALMEAASLAGLAAVLAFVL